MAVIDAKIHETTVTPNADGALVQLRISDASPGDADAANRLILAVQVPAVGLAPLAEIERQALDLADTALQALLREKADQLKGRR